jgi:CRISPR-associated protein Cmr2
MMFYGRFDVMLVSVEGDTYEIWSLPMKYLFQASIGPVQDFIASARRTHDLAFGSWFLSEISRAAAYQIVQANGQLIFPYPNDLAMLKPGDAFNVANKIVALVQQSPDELSMQVYKALLERLGEIRNDAFKGVNLPKENQEIAEAQIKDLVEFLWVALPYVEHTYEELRQQLEKLMVARKNTRNFARVMGRNWPKSSIDGQLESVIPESEYPARGESDEKKRIKILKLYDNYRAGQAEQLSGVDLLKRRGNMSSDSHFPSTSHLATLPFLKRLEILKAQKPVKEAWNTYIAVLQSLPVVSPRLEQIPNRFSSHPIIGKYEGSMLFEDRLVDVLYLPASDPNRNTSLQQAKRAYRDFYEVIDAAFTALGLDKKRPGPYYALLQADGDGMGEVIDAHAVRGYERHRQLSQQLADFASGVRVLVEQKSQGALIYAGGDDVLAFLPLHTVLQCARELATTFHDAMKDFANKQGRTPTLSVGIAIIHHLDPLRDARELAKRAERHAKRIEGKNALSIIVRKRSGEDYPIAGSWGKGDPDQGIAYYLEELIKFCRNDAIPDGTAYELRDMVRRLTGSAQSTPIDESQKQRVETLQKVIKRETVRILRRKLTVPQGKFTKEQTDKVMNFLQTRLGIEQEKTDEEGITPALIEEFINELIIAQTLADAKQLAEPKKEGVEL